MAVIDDDGGGNDADDNNECGHDDDDDDHAISPYFTASNTAQNHPCLVGVQFQTVVFVVLTAPPSRREVMEVMLDEKMTITMRIVIMKPALLGADNDRFNDPTTFFHQERLCTSTRSRSTGRRTDG